MTEDEGRNGFFRWNDHICMFIKNNWSRLLPYRKKTGSWQSTVAGVLSQYSPSIFKSGRTKVNNHTEIVFCFIGTALLCESGWWSLQNYEPPEPKWHNTKEGIGVDHVSSTAINMEQESRDVTWQEIFQRSSSLYYPDKKEEVVPQVQEQVPPKSSDKGVTKDSAPKFVCMTVRQETILLQHLDKFPVGLANNSKARRLAQKLRIRAMKRSKGKPLFDLDKTVIKNMEERLRNFKGQTSEKVDDNEEMIMQEVSDKDTAHNSQSCVLDRLLSKQNNSMLCSALPSSNSRFVDYIQGQSYSMKSIVSPFTSRVLKPFIWRDHHCSPVKVKLLEELIQYHNQRLQEKPEKYESMSIDSSYLRQPIQYCYLQEHHVPVVNSLIQEHFWPGVDVNECTQYPDFTVVALYGHLVIGCGFLTPDVKPCEAYISFLLVHPDFQKAGIATFMLYHLIQTCMGKDVTLHCSVDNPAVLLYQKFGFKVEEFCLDFYDKYYPVKHYLSKHAFFMRLKR